MSTVIDNGTDQKTREFVEEDGDSERFSHYAPKDQLDKALIEGTPVIALCGKTWVPTKDPKRFPVCPECKEIYETLRDE